MKKLQQWKWQYLLALALVLAMLFAPGAALAENGDDGTPPSLPSLQWSDDLSYAKYLVRNHAYYDLDAQVLSAKDVPALIKALQKTDKWAEYYSKEELGQFIGELEGDFVGIGIYADVDEAGQLLVHGVIANSPAEKAGLKFGDIIVGVDELSAPQATAEELREALGGEENSLLLLKYKRDGRVIEEFMNRKRITVPSMEYWLLEEDIGYLWIEQFTTHTGEELAAAAKSLKKQGMKALLVDLRDCPGGEMEGALGSCGVLAGAGPMLFFLDRDGWYSFAPVDEAAPLGLPLAVLINGDTASAAEIVAGNVQDSGAGVLIGVPSYGKSVMQELIELPSGAGIKFTTDKIVTRGYQDIDAAGGLMPDIYVTDEEAQLDEAVAWLKEQMAQPRFLKFYVGLNGYSLGGLWQNLTGGALLNGGAAYVPLALTLSHLGWRQEERNGIIYFSSGVQRLIVDRASQSLITGQGSQTLVSSNGSLYLPAALLRQYGYTVTWNNAERSLRIDK
jgi:carboxyl-terminal processing protease